MHSTSGFKKNKKGTGHGQHNHRHASGNGIVRYYYGAYQQETLRRGHPKSTMFATIRDAFAGKTGRQSCAI